MDLDQLRLQINQTDDQLIELFRQRMQLAGKVAEYKQEHHLPIFQPEREQQVLDRVSAQAGEEFAGGARVLFGSLMDVSKTHQQRILSQSGSASETLRRQIETALEASRSVPEQADVACSGVPGAYAHEAACRLFTSPELTFYPQFEDVFEAVADGRQTFGVLPIENSIAGSVVTVYDLLRKYRLTICKSYKLPVDHCLLMCEGGSADSITDIYSHEQALSQCSQFLRAHPEIRTHVYSNTAAAAQHVAQLKSPHAAAIASRACAELYGLKVLQSSLQNVSFNRTRFIVVSRDLIIPPDANKISLSMTLPHVTGSLSRTIMRFALQSLNLTKLESRPLPDTDFEFLFYFDVEGSMRDPAVLDLICSLAGDVSQFEFLGNYR